MNFLWAASLSIYKALADYLEPGGIVTLRFGLAALALAALWPWLPGRAPRGRDLLKTLLMGLVVFTLGHRLQVYGNKLGTAGNSSVLMAVEPLLTSVAAAIFLREHIGPRRWVGFSLGMFGVVMLNGSLRGDVLWGGMLASLVFISSFICEALYSIMGKPLMEGAGMMKILTLALLFGLAGNLLIDPNTKPFVEQEFEIHVKREIGRRAGHGFDALVERNCGPLCRRQAGEQSL